MNSWASWTNPRRQAAEFDCVAEQTIGSIDELEQILMQQVIDEVVIALPVKSRYQQIQHVIGVCERAGVQAKYGADLFESAVASPRYDAEGDRAFVAMHVAPDDYRLVDQARDRLVGAAVGLVLLRAADADGGDRDQADELAVPSFTRRTGAASASAHSGCTSSARCSPMPTSCRLRWRTATRRAARCSRSETIPESPRSDACCAGRRSTSCRSSGTCCGATCPLSARGRCRGATCERITRPTDMRRFSMRPGLTCLWQVQGRSNLSFERWVELDLEYIDTWSLSLDCRILLKTIRPC